MASTRKYNMDGETPEPIDTIQDEIEAAGGNPENSITARVYRILPNDGSGREGREYCGVFSKIVDEELIGNKYGGGRFFVHYRWKDKNGEAKQTSRIFRISDVFNKDSVEREKAEAPAPAVNSLNGGAGVLSGFLSNLSAEKIAGGLSLLKAVKDFLAPPPPPVDYTKLLEIMASQNQKPTYGDAILMKALETTSKPAPAQPSIIQQVSDLKALADTIKDNFVQPTTNPNKSGDKMDTLIEMALPIIQELLKKHNNNFTAVGQEAAQSNMVKRMVAKDPDLAQKFLQRAADDYGMEAAKQLAAGFGVPITFEEPAPESAPEPAAIGNESAVENI